jgi:heat shock protein HslJ
MFLGLLLQWGAMAADDAPDTLDGSAWILSELPPDDLLDKVTATLSFDGGTAAGTDGCNRYSGAYTFDGNELRFGQLAVTMMACPEPVMEQAKRYQDVLEAARGARREEDSLVLVDAAGELRARYDAQPATLADTRWTVTGYNNGKGGVVSVAAGTSLSLEFDAAGAVSGSAGCNRFRGSYTEFDGTVEFGPLAASRKMCQDEVMEQEAMFLEALPRGTTLRFEADRLELRNEDGALQVAARFAD